MYNAYKGVASSVRRSPSFQKPLSDVSLVLLHDKKRVHLVFLDCYRPARCFQLFGLITVFPSVSSSLLVYVFGEVGLLITFRSACFISDQVSGRLCCLPTTHHPHPPQNHHHFLLLLFCFF